MKISEFIVGDWVWTSGHPVQVEAINRHKIGYLKKYWKNFEYIEPILLTPEMLELNGIKKRGDEYMIFGWEGEKQWYVSLEDFKPQYDFWFITSSDRSLNVRGQIRYVHELQHSLRLCGLNELADNFKLQ